MSIVFVVFSLLWTNSEKAEAARGRHERKLKYTITDHRERCLTQAQKELWSSKAEKIRINGIFYMHSEHKLSFLNVHFNVPWL